MSKNGRGSEVRRFVVVVGAVALLACWLSAPASARVRIDRSFGNNGVIHYHGDWPGYARANPTTITVDPEGRIYLIEYAIRCQPACVADVYLVRLQPDGSPDSSYGHGTGSILVFADVPTGFPYGDTQVTIDEEGRALAALREKEAFVLRRLRPGGARDRSFDDDGTVSLPCSDCEDTHLVVRPRRGGGILLWGRRLERRPDIPGRTASQESMVLARLSSHGNLDTNFGGGGWATAPLRGSGEPTAIATRRGTTTLAGGGCCQSGEGIFLARFLSDGSYDRAFAERSARSLADLHLPSAERPKSVRAIVPGPHGALELFGNTEEGGYVLRVGPRGRIDRRFGRDGIKRFNWQLTMMVPAGKGGFWAIGQTAEFSGTLVFRLRRGGKMGTSFALRQAARLRGWEEALIEPQSVSRAVLFDPGYSFCRTYCPPRPKMTRVTAKPAQAFAAR
jgi:uncharacterized delta-60 repeat protein